MGTTTPPSPTHHAQPAPTPQMAMPPALIDVTAALSPADAFRMAGRHLAGWLAEVEQAGKKPPINVPVAIDCGALVLTPKLLQKIVVILRQYQCTLGMIYARLPQTQQAALGMGLLVKEAPEIGDDSTLSPEAPSVAYPHPVNHSVMAEPGHEAMASEGFESLTSMMPSEVAGAHPPAPSLSDLADAASQHALQDVVVPRIPPAIEDDYTALPTETLPDTPTGQAQVGLAAEQLFDHPVEGAVVTTPAQMLSQPVAESASPELISPSQLPTRMVFGSLRSGRTLASDGHLVVVGDVHGGSEIVAAGNIVVWGELRGVAHAGAHISSANTTNHQPCLGEDATVRALAIHAVQLRVGRLIARRPDRLDNHKPETNRQADGSVGPITPEIARVVNGEVRIYQALD